MNDGDGTVYVVDDDASVRTAVRNLVLSLGLRVEAFEDAQQFLRARVEARPACLVLDVSLPGLDGLELQRRLADDGDGLPVVFLSGYGRSPLLRLPRRTVLRWHGQFPRWRRSRSRLFLISVACSISCCSVLTSAQCLGP